MKPPFPYFGGKSRIASEVWKRFGRVRRYIEPFCGSCAVLLARPEPIEGIEIVNDKNGFVANFWRAVQHDPQTVATIANHPPFEIDLHARRKWLIKHLDTLVQHLESDPNYYNSEIAGWWLWAVLLSIGREQAIQPYRSKPCVSHPQAFTRKKLEEKLLLIKELQTRLQTVFVLCGDWRRAVTPAAIYTPDDCAVFLDPPYSHSVRDQKLYRIDENISADVRAWALDSAQKWPGLRIALCGYEGKHDMPSDWECLAWQSAGGYGNQSKRKRNENRFKERIWFSPSCLKPERSLLVS